MKIHIHKKAIIEHLRERIPTTKLIYLFGSYATGYETEDSDINLAVWSVPSFNENVCNTVSHELTDLHKTEVNVLDLSGCKKVIRYEIVTHGKCWFNDGSAASFEETVRTMYALK
jgi:predicted nucleotidyltransferase